MTVVRSISDAQRGKAAAFAELHRSGCFVLPNAWDVASALLCHEAGFAAVATSSAGVALSRGIPDGERLGRDAMLHFTGELARRLPVPVSADLEAGYGTAPDAVADTVAAAIAAGLVGCNIEDSDPATGQLLDPALAADRIRAAAESKRAAGLDDFVVNARVDCYLRGQPPEQAFDEAVARADRYLAAGASCAFVPGPADAATAAALVAAIDGPVNVMAGGLTPTASLAELAAAGVRRISLGGSLMASAYAHTHQVLQEIQRTGNFSYTETASQIYRVLGGAIHREAEKESADA